jgi:ribonuclease HI
LGNYPEELHAEALILLDYLHGKAPVSAGLKDKRGWGSPTGNYTATTGYKAALNIPWVPSNPGPWKAIWNFPSIPKIDHFAWTLTHNSILTFDNLKKRGWEGPSRCPLCRSQEETPEHLLLECEFSKKVWSHLIGTACPSLPSKASELLSSWQHLAPFNLRKKHCLKTAWMWTPKFTCWKLWLERNNRIFNEVERLPSQVAIQARTMLAETLQGKANLNNSVQLSEDEDKWFKEISQNFTSSRQITSRHYRKWEIRLEEQAFLQWRSSLKEWSLFFDGASKGNPGQAGGGGVILDPARKVHLEYAWGLGYASNNHAEFLALWQGLKQVIKSGIQEIRIFGDSLRVVEALNTRKAPKDCTLAQVYRKSLILLLQLKKYHVYHVLRSLNGLADSQANRGALMGKGILTSNELTSPQPIP